MEWIEVADTAVKIGLGAAISGVATYWITKVNYHHEFTKDRRKRKRELMEEIATQVVKSWEKTNDLFSSEAGRLNSIKDKPELSKLLKEQIHKNYVEHAKAMNDLSNAEAKLRLLGQKSLCELLMKFHEVVRKGFLAIDISSDSSKSDTAAFIKIYAEASILRNNFLDELSLSYMKVE
jgi:hypothetical protein